MFSMILKKQKSKLKILKKISVDIHSYRKDAQTHRYVAGYGFPVIWSQFLNQRFKLVILYTHQKMSISYDPCPPLEPFKLSVYFNV